LAQEKKISGVIIDDKDKTPLSGVSVVVKGSSSGAMTDADGKFTLTVPSGAKSLVVTRVDYVENEIPLGGKTTFMISMTSSTKALSEVVVVAYGNQRKESITGSVAVIGADQLQSRVTTNITQALAGAAPGISATSGNGQPGSSAAIRIRGFGSVNASNSPLYVVDGFPYEGFIGDLNVADIESISLLKDASSTALYGARAANGVILITTKREKRDSLKLM